MKQFKNKRFLLVQGGSQLAHWLLDQDAYVTLADHSLIRPAQAHVRARVRDGQEYERKKKRLSWVQEGALAQAVATSDIVVATADHAAISLAREQGIPVIESKEVRHFSEVPPRREVVYESKKITVVHDAAAQSPAAAIPAIEQFGGPNCILIAGGSGTASYRAWAEVVRRHIRPTNIIFIEGSATRAMRKCLGEASRGVRAYETLTAAWRAARKRSGLFINSVVLLSPAAQSVTKDFSALVRRTL